MSSLIRELSDEPMSSVVQPTHLKKLMPSEYSLLEPEVKDQFFYVVGNAKAAYISEMKLDEERPWPISDQSKDLAILYIDQTLEAPLTHEMWTDEKTIDHISSHGTLKKAPGFPIQYLKNYFGTRIPPRSRFEFIQTIWWLENKENFTEIAKLGMCYMSTLKKEWAEIQDLHDEKARTYLIGGFHLLYWQLRLFGQGNENLKNFLWSYYGFNPFSGGANKMAQRILLQQDGKYVRPIRFTWDVKGYDRKIELYTTAKRRLRYFAKTSSNLNFLKFAEWITDGWITSVVILKNGDVVFRRRGNNSGSGTTTANNIEAGFEVLADICISAYFYKYKKYPSRTLVMEQLIHLYGDDNLGGVYEDFDKILDYTWLSDRLLRFHGLVLKTFTGGYEHPLGDLPFLGFTLDKLGDYYFPKWSRKRLLLPLIYQYEDCSLSEYCQQFYSVLLMSYAHQTLWKQLREIYLELLVRIAKVDGSPQFKSMYALGAPTDMQMFSWYQGLEAWTEDGPQTSFVMSENLINILKKNPVYQDVLKNVELEGVPKNVHVPRSERLEAKPNVSGGVILLQSSEVDDLFKWDIDNYDLKRDYYRELETLRVQQEWSVPKYDTYLGTCGNVYFGESSIQTPFTANFRVNLLSALTNRELINKLAFCMIRYIELCIFRELIYQNQLQYLKTHLLRIKALFFKSPDTKLFSNIRILLGDMKEERHVIARIAMMRKTGSFNEYGNEQMDTAEYYSTITCRNFLSPVEWKRAIARTSPISKYSCYHDFDDYFDTSDDHDTNDDDLSQLPPHFMFWELCGGSQAYGNKNRSIVQLSCVFMFWELCGGSKAYGNRNKGHRAKYIAGLPKGLTAAQKEAQWLQHKALQKTIASKGPQRVRKTQQQKVSKDPTNLSNKMKPKSTMQVGQYGSTQPLLMMHPRTEGPIQMRMSECAARFAIWLTDPFIYFRRQPRKGFELKYERILAGIVTTLPCIPSFPALPSYKFIALLKGTFNVNAAGFGFIVFSPFRPGSNYSIVVDNAAPIMVSSNAWAGAATTFPTFDTGAAPAAGVNPQNWSTPFLIATLTNANTFFRNTFCGLQVSYSGSLMNTSGDYYHVHDGAHQSLSAKPLDNFSTLPGYYTESITRGKWSQQIWCHAMEDEFTYNGDPIVGTGTGNYLPEPEMSTHHIGIFIAGAPASTSFRYEIIAGFEAMGFGINQTKTANLPDSVGMDIIGAHVNPDTTRAMNTNPSFLQNMFESPTVSYAASKVGRLMVDYAVNRIGSWAGTGVGMAQQHLRLQSATVAPEGNPGYTVEDAPDDLETASHDDTMSKPSGSRKDHGGVKEVKTGSAGSEEGYRETEYNDGYRTGFYNHRDSHSYDTTPDEYQRADGAKGPSQPTQRDELRRTTAPARRTNTGPPGT